MINLQDCFDVLPESGSIRLKGTRIGLEHVIDLYNRGRTPEQIVQEDYTHVSRGLIYAAITYYLLNREEYEDYMRRGDERAEQLKLQYWNSLTPEQREKQIMMTNRFRDLKARFMREDGTLDVEGLRAYRDSTRAHDLKPEGVEA